MQRVIKAILASAALLVTTAAHADVMPIGDSCTSICQVSLVQADGFGNCFTVSHGPSQNMPAVNETGAHLVCSYRRTEDAYTIYCDNQPDNAEDLKQAYRTDDCRDTGCNAAEFSLLGLLALPLFLRRRSR